MGKYDPLEGGMLDEDAENLLGGDSDVFGNDDDDDGGDQYDSDKKDKDEKGEDEGGEEKGESGEPGDGEEGAEKGADEGGGSGEEGGNAGEAGEAGGEAAGGGAEVGGAAEGAAAAEGAEVAGATAAAGAEAAGAGVAAAEAGAAVAAEVASAEAAAAGAAGAGATLSVGGLVILIIVIAVIVIVIIAAAIGVFSGGSGGSSGSTDDGGSDIIVEGHTFPLESGKVNYVNSFGFPRCSGTGSGTPHEHAGADIMHSRSDKTIKVFAVTDGTIHDVRSSSGGHSIMLKSTYPGDNFLYYYTHLYSVEDGIIPGKKVAVGDVIARSGGTNGGAAGDHTHFGMEESPYIHGELFTRPLNEACKQSGGAVAKDKFSSTGHKSSDDGHKIYNPYFYLIEWEGKKK